MSVDLGGIANKMVGNSSYSAQIKPGALTGECIREGNLAALMCQPVL